jgi:hypothetical protein
VLRLAKLLACLLVVSTAFAADPTGTLQGHLKIIAQKEVDLADGTAPAVTEQTYALYPLVVLGANDQHQIATVTADTNGNYRVALPPGPYLLDIQDRVRKHVRAKPVPFSVVANQTVTVNFEMDTGIR